MTAEELTAVLHEVADLIGSLPPSDALITLADAGGRFLDESELSDEHNVPLDLSSTPGRIGVGYGIMLGWLAHARTAEQPQPETWFAGRTSTGRTVHIDRDPYTDGSATVVIDGSAAGVRSVSRLRDGGTTCVRTDRGTILIDRKLGRDEGNRHHRLDDERLL